MRNAIAALVTFMTLVTSASAYGSPETHKSYVGEKTDLVMHSFLVFNPARTEEQAQNPLQALRERDAVLLPGGSLVPVAGAYGAAMLAAMCIVAAHAPAPLRPLIDGRVHLGPARFDGGGMGAGLGGRF